MAREDTLVPAEPIERRLPVSAAAPSSPIPRQVTPEWLTAVLRAARSARRRRSWRSSASRSAPARSGAASASTVDSPTSPATQLRRRPRAYLPRSSASSRPTTRAACRRRSTTATICSRSGFYRELQAHGRGADAALLPPRDLGRHLLASCCCSRTCAGRGRAISSPAARSSRRRRRWRELAALHAPRWGDPSLRAIEWLEGPSPDRARDARRPLRPGAARLSRALRRAARRRRRCGSSSGSAACSIGARARRRAADHRPSRLPRRQPAVRRR